MQEEMIANMELKANKKLLEQIKIQKEEEELRRTRQEF
jgi:hypothetical protein